MSDRKAVIKNADMSEEMQQDAVDCATQALEKYNIEKGEWFRVIFWQVFQEGLSCYVKGLRCGRKKFHDLWKVRA